MCVYLCFSSVPDYDPYKKFHNHFVIIPNFWSKMVSFKIKLNPVSENKNVLLLVRLERWFCSSFVSFTQGVASVVWMVAILLTKWKRWLLRRNTDLFDSFSLGLFVKSSFLSSYSFTLDVHLVCQQRSLSLLPHLGKQDSPSYPNMCPQRVY